MDRPCSIKILSVTLKLPGKYSKPKFTPNSNQKVLGTGEMSVRDKIVYICLSKIPAFLVESELYHNFLEDRCIDQDVRDELGVCGEGMGAIKSHEHEPPSNQYNVYFAIQQTALKWIPPLQMWKI